MTGPGRREYISLVLSLAWPTDPRRALRVVSPLLCAPALGPRFPLPVGLDPGIGSDRLSAALLAAGGDALCRARARASWRDPDDREAAERATRELLRRGAPVPRELLAHRPTLPPRVVDVDLPLWVYVERRDGSVELVGTTPRPGGVHLPEHVRWWVQPWGKVEPESLVRALQDHAIDGLELDLRQHALLAPVLEAAPAALRRLKLQRVHWELPLLRGIAALPGLDALHLTSPELPWRDDGSPDLDDEALATALRGTRLVELGLAGTAVGDDGLRVLADQPALRQIELQGLEGVTGRGLRHAAELRRLEEVAIRGCPALDDAGLAELAPARALRRLAVVGGTRFDGRGLRWLAVSGALDSLEGLELAGEGLAEDRLGALCELPRLSSLTLGGSRLGDRAAELAGRVEALRRLSLRLAGVTGAGLAHLGGLERLEVQAADPAGLAGVTQRSPGLVELTLHGAAVSIELLRAIVSLERLEVLRIEAGPGARPSYAGLGRAPRLARLRVGDDVSDEDVRGIVRARSLVELDLRARGLSGDGVLCLGQATGLRKVTLRASWPLVEDCPCCEEVAGVSEEKERAIQELRRDLPDCDVDVTCSEDPIPVRDVE